MQSPVALELLELLARSHIPQPDRPVARPTDKQGGIRRIETDAIYITAAIFSNVSFTGTTKKKKLDRGKHATLGKMQSPVALELLELLARSHIPQPDAVVVLT